jgi:plastocyanin
MGRAFLVLSFLVVAALPAAAGSADMPRLVGTVGPGFTIDLVDADGRHVEELAAGRYELLIHDLSDIHNFVLGEKATGHRPAQTEIEFIGDKTFTVDLKPGLWVYACTPHFATMNGHFTVVPEVSETPTAPPAAANAASQAARSLRATLLGARPGLSAKTVPHGRYAIRVSDRSRSRGFRLAGPGVRRQTAKAFVGTTTWRVTLRKGVYRFGTDVRMTGRLVVT